MQYTTTTTQHTIYYWGRLKKAREVDLFSLVILLFSILPDPCSHHQHRMAVRSIWAIQQHLCLLILSAAPHRGGMVVSSCISYHSFLSWTTNSKLLPYYAISCNFKQFYSIVAILLLLTLDVYYVLCKSREERRMHQFNFPNNYFLENLGIPTSSF